MTPLCEIEYLFYKKYRFVFVLLYSWDFRNVWFTRIGPAEQICIGFYRLLVAPPEWNNQFCICFAILLGHQKRYFCNVLTIFSSIFITVYGLGGASADLGSFEGKNAADFCTSFSMISADIDSLRITVLTICCTARAKQTVLY